MMEISYFIPSYSNHFAFKILFTLLLLKVTFASVIHSDLAEKDMVVSNFSKDNLTDLVTNSSDVQAAEVDKNFNDTAGLEGEEMSTTTTHLSALDIPNNTSNSTSLASSAEKRKCTQKDSAGLNKCLQQVLKDVRPRLAKGIPEMNLPPLEPLKLENIAFEQGSGAVKIVSHFTNVEIFGLSNFSQSEFWVDVPKRTLDFDVFFPQLSLVGTYELSGNLFFIPMGGNGEFHLSLGGIRTRGISQLSVFRNATAAQVVVKKTEISLEIDTIKVHLTNLFNGDPFMGTFINNFLNENSQEVFAEVKPQIGTQVGELLSLLANRALAALSTNQFDEVPFSPSPAEESDQRLWRETTDNRANLD